MPIKLKYDETGFTIIADDTADLLKVFDHVMEGPQVVEVRNNVTVEGPSPWADKRIRELVKQGAREALEMNMPETFADFGPLIGEELFAKSGIRLKVDEPEWIKWNGGDCPVDRLKNVEVKFRNETTDNEESAGYWDWSHGVTPLQADIIAYRVIA